MYTQNKPVSIGLSQSDLDRRERILAAKAERDAVKKQDDKELNAWKYWANQYDLIVK